MVLDDGSMVGMTYIREHEVVGWHRHTTGSTLDGVFVPDVIEDICCVPGEGYDRVHAVIRRTIGGEIVDGVRIEATEYRFIERMENYFVRQSDINNAFFVDSGVKFGDTTAFDATLSTNTGEDVTFGLLPGSVFFNAGIDVGMVISAGAGRLTITSVNSPIQVTGDVTEDFSSTAIAGGDWSIARDTLQTLAPHLAGATVKVWADGAERPALVVGETGTVELDRPANTGCVGLAMVSVVAPTRPEIAAAEGTSMTLISKVNAAKLRLYRSSGVKAGASSADEDLEEVLKHDSGDPIPPKYVEFGDEEVAIDTGWDDEWDFTVLNDSPGPMTLLASTYDVELAEDL
jgi:hypothetical protein